MAISDCTHVPNPPCAGCRAEAVLDSISSLPLVVLIRDQILAHAAAAYMRGRREAFEEAAQWCETHAGDCDG